MIEIRQRELAQPEEPVWVACPFHVEVVSPVELELYVFSFQLVYDRAVVDAPNRSALGCVKLVASLLHGRDIDGANSKPLLRNDKVAVCLLLFRCDLEQYNF